jgi:hypothetical protein
VAQGLEIKKIRFLYADERTAMPNQLLSIECYDQNEKICLRQGVIHRRNNKWHWHTVQLHQQERIVGVQFGKRGSDFARVFDL